MWHYVLNEGVVLYFLCPTGYYHTIKRQFGTLSTQLNMRGVLCVAS